MIDRTALLRDLKPQLRLLEDDLRRRSADVPEFAETLHLEWEDAKQSNRTAATYESWLDDRVTQSAVAWILATVFIRFCEDNGLIDLPVIAGPGDRLAIAGERQNEFIAENPATTDRDWILQGIKALSVSKVAAGLFDEAHNPMWTVTPSHDAAKALLAFWRRRAESGTIVHDFTEPDWNTRFLGNLYQDLSEHAKKTYALLQTPEFVEEFILDYTLTPAIEEFDLTPDPPEARPDLPKLLRVIDPTCGSGHFLLGAFHRLLEQWEKKAPDADRWEQISRALSSVHGVDKNPFAAAIARFRLLIAAMKAADENCLADAPEFPINIAVGDSLLHGRGGPGIQLEFDLLNSSASRTHAYVTEDIDDYSKSVDMLGLGTYHVVVGNPPYITVKDKQENENYRKAYPSCSGKYALSVPFVERFFHLAIRGAQDRRGSGYVGQITANSFMKREFGKKLIEQFFRKIELTHVIDTSGAYIPGHGTPTVILFGRRRSPRQGITIRAVLSVKGELREPEIPDKGLVWCAIVQQVEQPGSESEWISAVDLPRERITHPWSLSGGGAGELLNHLEKTTHTRIKDHLNAPAGFAGFSANDEAFDFSKAWHLRRGTPDIFVRPLIAGKDIKSWGFEAQVYTLAPYDREGRLVPVDTTQPWWRQLWTVKRSMEELSDFSGKSRRDSGVPWWSWYHWVATRNSGGDRIIVAKIATHNEAAVNRGRTITNQHVFVLQVNSGDGASAEFSILAALNSSVGCFWLRQVSQDRGNRGGERSTARFSWERFFELTAAKLQEFPLPSDLSTDFGRELDDLAQRMSAVGPSAVCAEGVPTAEKFESARSEYERIRGRMIALQEELDWEIYRRYGLLQGMDAAKLFVGRSDVPQLRLGERAFEIRLAVKESEPEWFERHGSTPTAKIPPHWPDAYARIVNNRMQVIEEHQRSIRLLERPDCKRRWQSESWETKQRAALTSWLLDRCEDRSVWFAPDEWGRKQPRPVTVNRLADRLRTDGDMVSVARMLDGPDADLAEVLTRIIGDQHVPYLAQLRYTATGMRNRGQWEKTWDMQREEDAKGVQLKIDVPPKYKKEDFLKGSYWSQRGKLDVPKERFISYPLASPDGDDSLLLGWAGWDRREQAHALMTLIEDRSAKDGWGVEKLTPLIAGLAEVMPWVRQWHAGTDPHSGINIAEAYGAYLEDQRIKYGLSEEDLRTWSPLVTGQRRGRRRKSGVQPELPDQSEGV